MNKKTKNRNKQNKPNPKPPQKIVPIVSKPISEVESSTDEKQLEKVNEERVPEIISENIIPVNTNLELEKETPKKPKRNKNKKDQKEENVQDNKQSEVTKNEKICVDSQIVQDNKQSVVVKDEKICEDLQIVQDNKQSVLVKDENICNVSQIGDIEDDATVVTEPVFVDPDIVPITRKKKNKKKKNTEKLLETTTALESEVIPKEVNIMPSTTFMSNTFDIENNGEHYKSDNANKQEIKSKKRNKKKKKRNDSEKSDIPSGFDIQHPDSISNVISENIAIDNDTHNAKTIDVSETIDLKINATKNMVINDEKGSNSTQSLSEPLKVEIGTLLQKDLEVMPNQNFSSEIAQTTPEISIENDQIYNVEKSNQTKKTVEFEKPLKEKSPKSKAKIARPVEKKNDTKDEQSHKEETENIIKIEGATTKETIVSLPVTCLNEMEELIKIETKLCDLNVQELINEPAEIVISDKKISQEDISTISKLNENSEDILQESLNLCNIMPQSELSPLYEIDTSGIKPEEVEDSVSGISPDIIEYPRSSSEHISDLNNNTIIEEILTTQDVKSNVLDIPIVTNFTEIIEQLPGTSNTDKMEVIEDKTNLKSKMIEVNQDMQELKRSIEKSLAELTALEQSEENIENQLTVKKQDVPFSKIEVNETNVSSDRPVILDSTNICDIKSGEENTGTSIKKDIQEEAENKVDIPTEIELHKQTLLTQQKSPGKRDQSKYDEPNIDENVDKKQNIVMEVETNNVQSTKAPICPARKDNKGKSNSRRKGKQEAQQNITLTTGTVTEEVTQNTSKTDTKQEQNQTKTAGEKHGKSGEKGKQQSCSSDVNETESHSDQIIELTIEDILQEDYEPIENFEDALSTSIDDVNRTFELIANEIDENVDTSQNPEINIIAPDEETSDNNQDKKNPVPQPKNLLGHPDIPVQSNKTDYKKERNKTPNTKQAKVNIKDSFEIENKKKSKESQTNNKRKSHNDKAFKETVSCVTNGNEEYVYKYSFRKVFLPNACHVCKIELKKARVSCSYCNLVFYCSQKHKNEDWSQHQALCFAVSTVAHLKGHKHIYADSKGIVGHNYRLLRMQMIIACEKVLKRKLSACEQEALLYPRICVDTNCREWHQSKLKDCDGCGQVSYCSNYSNHLPETHQRWCNSYGLYQKLVCYQQTKGKLEPKLPTRVMEDNYRIPEKMNEVLASMYEEKIDMNDMQYAALTQLATAPLTAAYSYQISKEKMNLINSNKVKTFTLHVVGVELQFEADVLNKWEIFFLHLQPSIQELRVVMISKNLNSCNLPLDLLGKIPLCNNCTQQKRRVIFDFQDKNYFDYWTSDEYVDPHLVCAFNANIQRSSVHNGKDSWPSTINCVLKSKVPFLVTSYTLEELRRDAARIKECASNEYEVLSNPKINSFASVRPDRNFISDDEMPLLFKNYNYYVFRGVN